MASDGLGGAVPRSNPVTTVVLRPDPVAAGVPRLTSHGSTGGGGRRAACGRPPCSPLLLFLLPLLPARCRHRGCPPPACRVAAAVCRWTSTLTRPPRASPPRWTSRTREAFSSQSIHETSIYNPTKLLAADDHGGGCNSREAGGCCPGGGSRLVDSIDHTWAEEAVDSMMGLLAASSLGGAFSWGVLLPAMARPARWDEASAG
ncbi:hypothetical protein OsI_15242 [Oryza sativa Indica Group]|uniref:Uncharacterized protein n=2 Tax=Oryza sativa TaxID=4530 RepID=B9FEA1_ORYSJ|nr:hypothetical protein OsI_15242 [Oryza sativa Indica Group]EEE60684.1 hypothetical protein OsJ_14160 [Oryza sativa Japonica Group]